MLKLTMLNELKNSNQICGCGGTGRRAGLRNQYFGVEVQVLSSAPMTNLFELTDRDEINQKWLVFYFIKN